MHTLKTIDLNENIITNKADELSEEKSHAYFIILHGEFEWWQTDNINMDYILDTHNIVYMESSKFP